MVLYDYSYYGSYLEQVPVVEGGLFVGMRSGKDALEENTEDGSCYESQ